MSSAEPVEVTAMKSMMLSRGRVAHGVGGRWEQWAWRRELAGREQAALALRAGQARRPRPPQEQSRQGLEVKGDLQGRGGASQATHVIHTAPDLPRM